MAKEKGAESQEEQVARLILMMQNYFEGLQAANRRMSGSPPEVSAEVLERIDRYRRRMEEFAGPDFRAQGDPAPSLAQALVDARERVDFLIRELWPSKRPFRPSEAK